jgi:RNA-directed DNA polymerase
MIVERMAADLRLPETFIVNIARGASHEYKFYSVPKRNGGLRPIYHPSRRLKALQRWLLPNVVEKLPFHEVATAYQKGCSTLKNAKAHVNSNYLLRLDFVQFFESIRMQDIEAYIKDRQQYFEGWTTVDTQTFLQLVCKGGGLTIGSPTSPALSNAICFDLDQTLQSYCRTRDISYTRYADDLFFSAKRSGILNQLETVVPEICRRLSFPKNLLINTHKTRHSSKRGARRVTGLVLGSDDKVYVGRKIKRKIRAQIHQLESLNVEQKASLAGLISYVVGYDPQFINSLISKYGLPRIKQAQRKH